MITLPSKPVLDHGTPLVPIETDLWNRNPLELSPSLSVSDISDKGCREVNNDDTNTLNKKEYLLSAFLNSVRKENTVGSVDTLVARKRVAHR